MVCHTQEGQRITVVLFDGVILEDVMVLLLHQTM